MRDTSESATSELTVELASLRRRAARQKRMIKAGPDRWQRWSGTMTEIAEITERLARLPATDVPGLAAKFAAILWLIESNESLLDRGDLRRLQRFGRDLSGLAGGQSQAWSRRA
jgi:hypothetical protein